MYLFILVIYILVVRRARLFKSVKFGLLILSIFSVLSSCDFTKSNKIIESQQSASGNREIVASAFKSLVFAIQTLDDYIMKQKLYLKVSNLDSSKISFLLCLRH